MGGGAALHLRIGHARKTPFGEVELNEPETAQPDPKNVQIYQELQSLQDETSLALRDLFLKHRRFVLR